MGTTVVVTGDRRFENWKLLHSALKAFHAKHRIDTLVGGGLPGAEEMAYWWAVHEHIRHIITVPAQPDILNRYSFEARNEYMLDVYKPFAVVAFPGRETHRADMINQALTVGIKVWEVPANWRSLCVAATRSK